MLMSSLINKQNLCIIVKFQFLAWTEFGTILCKRMCTPIFIISQDCIALLRNNPYERISIASLHFIYPEILSRKQIGLSLTFYPGKFLLSNTFYSTSIAIFVFIRPKKLVFGRHGHCWVRNAPATLRVMSYSVPGEEWLLCISVHWVNLPQVKDISFGRANERGDTTVKRLSKKESLARSSGQI